MYCNSCGAELDYREAFCSQCGELTGRGRGAQTLISSLVGKSVGGISSFTDPSNRKLVVGVVAGLALILAVFTDNPLSSGLANLLSSAPSGPQMTADGLPDLNAYEDVFLTEDTEYTVLATANVRDYPTSQNSFIIRSLNAGETVIAREVQAFDPSSRWFKLFGGGYVWGGNLERAQGMDSGASDVGQSGAVFPDFLRGRWSWSADCQDQSSGDVTISANKIQFEDSLGTLVKLSEEGRYRVYHLAMSGEGQSWDADFSITIADDRSIMFLDGVGDTAGTNYVLHNRAASCGGG